MKRHQASRTAEYMAFFRALESVRPEGLSVDPFATNFIRPLLRRAVRFSKLPVLGKSVAWYTDRRLPCARTSAVTHTSLIDELLLAAVDRSVQQVVILGAGFDCRAYRLPQLGASTMFEVDDPSTLALKLRGLRETLPKIPDQVRFVEIDFNQQSLPGVLAQAGFQPSAPAAFVWEGVTNYLTADAVDSVLHYVAAATPGRLSSSPMYTRASWTAPFPFKARQVYSAMSPDSLSLGHLA